MDNKVLIAIAGVVVLVVAAAAVIVITADNTDMSSKTDGVRLTIYGNANGDDVIDEKDKKIIEKIASDNIADWKTKYIYADANQDGKITKEDAQVVQDYMDRKSTTLYYKDYFGTIAHIPYPIGDKVGIDHPYPALIMATCGLYDKLYAVDDMTGMYYDESTFPGLSKMKIIGSSTKITLEQVASAGVDAFIIYSNWPGCCYLYEEAEKSKLADKIAFITVDIKADDGVAGTIMMAALFNTNDSVKIAQDYTEKTVEVMNALDNAKINKKTAVFDYIALMGGQYWQYLCGGGTNTISKKVVNFTPGYENAGSIPVDEETLVATSKGCPIIIQFQAPGGVEKKDMQEYLKGRVQDMLKNTDAYKTKEIYAIDSDLINSVGAYFGAYLTASMLYGTFDYDDAVQKAEYFLKNFTPAKWGSSIGFIYNNTDLF